MLVVKRLTTSAVTHIEKVCGVPIHYTKTLEFKAAQFVRIFDFCKNLLFNEHTKYSKEEYLLAIKKYHHEVIDFIETLVLKLRLDWIEITECLKSIHHPQRRYRYFKTNKYYQNNDKSLLTKHMLFGRGCWNPYYYDKTSMHFLQNDYRIDPFPLNVMFKKYVCRLLDDILLIKDHTLEKVFNTTTFTRDKAIKYTNDYLEHIDPLTIEYNISKLPTIQVIKLGDVLAKCRQCTVSTNLVDIKCHCDCRQCNFCPKCLLSMVRRGMTIKCWICHCKANYESLNTLGLKQVTKPISPFKEDFELLFVNSRVVDNYY